MLSVRILGAVGLIVTTGCGADPGALVGAPPILPESAARAFLFDDYEHGEWLLSFDDGREFRFTLTCGGICDFIRWNVHGVDVAILINTFTPFTPEFCSAIHQHLPPFAPEFCSEHILYVGSGASAMSVRDANELYVGRRAIPSGPHWGVYLQVFMRKLDQFDRPTGFGILIRFLGWLQTDGSAVGNARIDNDTQPVGPRPISISLPFSRLGDADPLTEIRARIVRVQ